MHQITLAGSQ